MFAEYIFGTSFLRVCGCTCLDHLSLGSLSLPFFQHLADYFGLFWCVVCGDVWGSFRSKVLSDRLSCTCCWGVLPSSHSTIHPWVVDCCCFLCVHTAVLEQVLGYLPDWGPPTAFAQTSWETSSRKSPGISRRLPLMDDGGHSVHLDLQSSRNLYPSPDLCLETILFHEVYPLDYSL